MKLASFLLATVTTAAFAQTPSVPADAVAATRAQVTAIRDAFVKTTQAAGLSCAVPVPTIVVQDVPSFGSFDPATNTLTTPAWEQLSPGERAIFFKGGGPNTSEAAARADFELGVHHWVLVHELGHWWEACRGYADHGDHYRFEYVADQVAAAYWTEHDPAVIAHQKDTFTRLLQKWPNPVPAGQTASEYFNENYETLASDRAYIWFQAQMCIAAFSQQPMPSMASALAQVSSHP